MGRWAWMATTVSLGLALTSACSSEETGGSNGGGGTGGSTQSSSSSGSTGGQGGTDPSCHGDASTWDAIEKNNIACSKNSDCCVVVNPCTAESQVVHADDFAQAQSVWFYCDSDCVFCIAEYVDVACEAGQCVASPPPPGGEPQDGVSQCGVDDATPDLPQPGLFFGCQ